MFKVSILIQCAEVNTKALSLSPKVFSSSLTNFLSQFSTCFLENSLTSFVCVCAFTLPLSLTSAYEHKVNSNLTREMQRQEKFSVVFTSCGWHNRPNNIFRILFTHSKKIDFKATQSKKELKLRNSKSFLMT